ncbi:MAG: LemA family protein [Ignavibacteriales bacterium]|nr:LemA family protein [Ignavibacteriales bacterium]
MKKVLIALGIVFVLFIMVLMWGVGKYNGLVTLDESVNGSWAQVQNQYQRRMDLIPNLVATVQGVANFEKSTLQAVIEARAKATQVTLSPQLLNDPQAFQRFEQSQGQLGSALSRLLVTVEQYPNLKANENFLQLQSQLEGTENRIAVERKRFNEVVQGYNATIRTIPTSFIAGIGGFQQKQYFQSQAGAETAPKVQF